MDKQELIGKLGYLLDSTRLGHVKWAENKRDIYQNKTNKVRIVDHTVEIEGQCYNECEELRTRLFKAAKRSAVSNNKTYEELNGLKFDIDWGDNRREREERQERYRF